MTAGPTHEKIDPVRFIGNYSSGKMGYAIARVLAEKGADVILVSGPTQLTVNHPNIKRIDITSAEEMYNVSVEAFKQCDGAVLCAAVADFTPEVSFDEKVKRGKDDLILKLKPTPDIAATLGEQKRDDQFMIGFALETQNEIANARRKLKKKRLDVIVLNSLKDEGAGFQGDTNKITIVDKDNNIQAFELKSKKEAACDIVDCIIERMQSRGLITG